MFNDGPREAEADASVFLNLRLHMSQVGAGLRAAMAEEGAVRTERER